MSKTAFIDHASPRVNAGGGRGPLEFARTIARFREAQDWCVVSTNEHFTLKQNPLTRADLDDFVACYNPADRHQRQESDRFKRYTYDKLIARGKASLDLIWLRDESLEDIDNLPAPAVLAAQIAEDLQSALTEIRALTEALASTADSSPTTEATG